MAKHAACAGAGTVTFAHTMFVDMAHKVFVLRTDWAVGGKCHAESRKAKPPKPMSRAANGSLCHEPKKVREAGYAVLADRRTGVRPQ